MSDSEALRRIAHEHRKAAEQADLESVRALHIEAARRLEAQADLIDRA